MINLKLSIISAVFGLVVSFFLGLLGGNPFITVFLRSILCSVIMGGAMALASFVFRKFLADTSIESSNGDNSNAAPGSLVDITISEDVLPDSDNAPDFYVSKSYTASKNDLSENPEPMPKRANVEPTEPVQKQTVAQDTKEESSTFVPTSLAQESYTSSPKPQKNVEDSLGSLDSLDSLPEINNVFADVKPHADEVIEDSAFATGDKPPASDLVPDAAIGADASLMAEAIKTLLKREG